MRTLTLLVFVVAIASCRAAPAPQQPAPVPPPAPEIASKPPPRAGKLLDFTATAYTIEGQTADGAQTRDGVVAADPDVLPLGARIRVHDAGAYSGQYVVKDTGKKVQGRLIDIYVRNDGEAKRFGRKRVKVEVLSPGDS
jgi:3D (Asp-Asp-Asp) domain-containing protein